jgi:hypothetical protein
MMFKVVHVITAAGSSNLEGLLNDGWQIVRSDSFGGAGTVPGGIVYVLHREKRAKLKEQGDGVMSQGLNGG